jgi:hypothetical protein
MGTGPSVRLRRVIALPPLRPAVAGYRAPLPRACAPDRTAGHGQRILLGRHGTGTASRRERPALPAASSTLAWTENSPARRVIATTRSTRCCGAASSRSPPACRAWLRPRASAATPLQSMNSRPSTLNTRPCRVRADAELLQYHSAQPSGRGCPAQPAAGTPGPGHRGMRTGCLTACQPPAMTVKPSDLRPPARLTRRRPGSASRWPRHPPHRTHSHCPPRRHAPPPGQDAPAQANSPPRQLTPATAHAAPGPDGTP